MLRAGLGRDGWERQGETAAIDGGVERSKNARKGCSDVLGGNRDSNKGAPPWAGSLS